MDVTGQYQLRDHEIDAEIATFELRFRIDVCGCESSEVSPDRITGIVLCFLSQAPITPMFCRSDSRISLPRTSDRAKMANTSRPTVAALAATMANSKGLPSGTLKPIHDMATHAGGANAGIRLISSTTTKRITSVAMMHFPADRLFEFHFAVAETTGFDVCQKRAGRGLAPRISRLYSRIHLDRVQILTVQRMRTVINERLAVRRGTSGKRRPGSRSGPASFAMQTIIVLPVAGAAQDRPLIGSLQGDQIRHPLPGHRAASAPVVMQFVPLGGSQNRFDSFARID